MDDGAQLTQGADPAGLVPRVLPLGFALLALAVGVTAANALFGLGGAAAQAPIRDWVSSGVYILVAGIVALRTSRAHTKRRSWAVFALGLALYGCGNLLWSFWIGTRPHPPLPSVCDAFWLALYPLSYAGIVGLARDSGSGSVPAGVSLDGLIAGSGLLAFGAALVFPRVLHSATGTPMAVATELAYPIADLLLAALVVGVLALRGWRVDRAWALLGGGFVLLTVADCLYAIQVANGLSRPTPMTNLAYVVAVALLACAAWQQETEVPPQLHGWSVLLVPAGFSLGALGLLIYDHFHRLDVLAMTAATVTLLAAIVRLGLAFRDLRGLSEARVQASTDDLTSLPNRRLFIRRARAAVRSAQRVGGECAVMMLDLDNFKQLNDTLGHDAGDDLLRQVGVRLRQCFRNGDTVARLGGDEFAVLLDPAPNPEALATIARAVQAAINEPFEVHGLTLRSVASLGIALSGENTVEELMRHADIAMYRAKAKRTGHETYVPAHDDHTRARLSLSAQLAAALEGDGLTLNFQPKADARSRQIIGVEALLRLSLPSGEFVPPQEVIAAADQAGLSRAVTRQVLRLALRELSAWRAAGHDLNMAVNTTVADLLDVSFPAEVAAALDACGLPRSSLILEITESLVTSDPERIAGVLATLSELGIALSLDDFGTGYSSLTHLKELPVTELKLDRSFVAPMTSSRVDAAIVTATIELAHSLGLRVVAEGVEDEATWTALARLDCELIQGYLLSRPVPASELEPMLTRQTAGAKASRQERSALPL